MDLAVFSVKKSPTEIKAGAKATGKDFAFGRERSEYMILVLDIGNTNIKLGVFSDKNLISSWRMQTKPGRTADEYGINLINLLRLGNIKNEDIKGAVFCSVVPTLNYTIEHMIEYYLNLKPMVAGAGLKTGINIKYENPKEVGTDRIVNCIAAYNLYGKNKPLIVIDFGTAITFNVVSKNGEFLGGPICPGIKVSMDALVNSASKLPRIELCAPKDVVGKSTICNMQSGFIFGFMGMVDYLIKKIKQETNFEDAVVVATGGFAKLLASDKIADKVDKTLTLQGLRMLYELNN